MKQAAVNSLPRHLSPLEDGSKWDDQKWVFPVTTAGARSNTFSMDWNIPIGDKTLLDPEFSSLLNGWRFILWVFTSCPPDGNPRKGSYCSKLRPVLRLLLPWMVENNLSDLSGLDQHGFSLFRIALQDRLFPDSTAVERRVTEGATDVSISVYISMFRLPYIARAELLNAGIPYPHSDPLQGKDAFSIANSLSKLKTVPTKEIDDDVYIVSVNTAVATITAHWVEDLISLNNLMSQRSGDDASYLLTEFFDKYKYLSSHKTPSTAHSDHWWLTSVLPATLLSYRQRVSGSRNCAALRAHSTAPIVRFRRVYVLNDVWMIFLRSFCFVGVYSRIRQHRRMLNGYSE